MQHAHLNHVDVTHEGYLMAIQGNPSHLENNDFSEVDFEDVNLEFTDLHNANFSRTNLHQASLQGTNLDEAALNEADLRQANLSGSNLGHAILSGAQLKGAKYDAETRFPQGFEPADHEMRRM